MEYKAILFDLDGTLLDSVPTILKAARDTFNLMKDPYIESDVRKSIGVPLEVQARFFAGDRATEFEDVYRSSYRNYLYEGNHLFPRTAETLNTLTDRGCLLALVTSKSSRAASRALEHTGIAGMFHSVVTADDVEHFKPHPESILKALTELNVERSQAAYVGDSMFDVDAAKKANVTMAAVSWGARSREELLIECPDSVFDTWREFLIWLGIETGRRGKIAG